MLAGERLDAARQAIACWLHKHRKDVRDGLFAVECDVLAEQLAGLLKEEKEAKREYEAAE